MHVESWGTTEKTRVSRNHLLQINEMYLNARTSVLDNVANENISRKVWAINSQRSSDKSNSLAETLLLNNLGYELTTDNFLSMFL